MRIMYAPPSGVMVSFSPSSCPMRRILPSGYSLYTCSIMASLFTPAAISSETAVRVEGNTELAKLLVSVVMPVRSAVRHLAGSRLRSPSMSGMALRR